MTRLFSKLAVTAILVGAIAGQAQARTELRFPYKGAPYAVQVPDISGAPRGFPIRRGTCFPWVHR